MKVLEYGRSALVICVTAMLAGCGGLQPPSTASVVPTALRTRAAVGSEDLLYASAFGAERVYVYSYPKGKLLYSLRVTEPSGLCVDQANNVWVTGVVKMIEYAHGGKKPIATLTNDGYGYSCSVDPTTGDLAVADAYSISNKRGFVAIYPQAQGTPTLYQIPTIAHPSSCGYDDQGNLFVDGSGEGRFKLVELPKGGSAFTKIGVKQSIGAGNIQWDGSYLAIGDANSGDSIYQFAIRGNRATVKSSTQLSVSSGGSLTQFWVSGGTVVAGVQLPGSQGLGVVGFWNYPAGGSSTKAITGLVNPFGVAISLAK